MLTRTSILLCFSFLLAALSLGQSLPSTHPSHYLAIAPVDSTSYSNMYSDQSTRDSIRSGYSNSHRAAKAIERYALEQQPTPFLKTVENDNGRDRWEVALSNGETTRLNPRVVSRASADLTFEHYHPDHKLIVFRSQWVEGNGYVLVSRVDGASVKTFGPPVFSPSGKWFITFNEDTVASYSPNGLQVFKSKKNPEDGDFDFEKVLSYRMEVLGLASREVEVTEEIESRARTYEGAGIRPFDGLHLASAVMARAEVFCTTDDDLYRIGQDVDTKETRVLTPVELIEVIES